MAEVWHGSKAVLGVYRNSLRKLNNYQLVNIIFLSARRLTSTGGKILVLCLKVLSIDFPIIPSRGALWRFWNFWGSGGAVKQENCTYLLGKKCHQFVCYKSYYRWINGRYGVYRPSKSGGPANGKAQKELRPVQIPVLHERRWKVYCYWGRA
jgi:hypothetical protein